MKRVDGEEPGYASFLQEVKEVCHGKGVSIGELWKRVKANANTEVYDTKAVMSKALSDAVKQIQKETK